MSHTIIYNPELHVIEMKVHGFLTLHEIKELISESTEIASVKNCFLWLNDFREAELNLDTLEIYEIPKIISDIQSSSGLDKFKFKRALVVAKDLKDFSFFETVSFNQAQNVKLFQDIDEAKKWLLEQ